MRGSEMYPRLRNSVPLEMQGPPLHGEQDASLAWFTHFQLNHVIRNGVIPDWFHGVISRNVAEGMLMYSPRGCFLIRLSQTRIGYTLSYRGYLCFFWQSRDENQYLLRSGGEDRCRHFAIAVDGSGLYNITGENAHHKSLQDLVDFHHQVPILPFNELLTGACAKTKQSANIGPAAQFSLSLTDSKSSYQTVTPTSLSDLACSPTPYPCVDTGVSTNLQSQSMISEVQPVPRPRKSWSSTSCLGNTEAPVQPLESLVPGGGEETSIENSSSIQQSPASSQPRVKSRIKLIHLIKKPHMKKSASEEHMNAKVSQESAKVPDHTPLAALENRNAGGRAGTENVYQELPGAWLLTDPHSVPVCRPELTGSSAGQQLPEEYLLPPPFAPGY